MSPLWRIARAIWGEERTALARGLALSVIVLLAGAALLGLSGWFVTATGAAGVAGIGIAFDVFRPSAGVRMLALGRTAARYGERILTHDATLRSLARLRLRVLDGLSMQPVETLARLRSPSMLNRVTADVDALDGVAIRLVFPILAGGVTLVAAGALLVWLVAPVVALWVVGTLATGAALAMIVEGRRAIAPAAEAEAARQALRSAAVEHLRARAILTFAGSLLSERAQVLAHDAAARTAERRLTQLDRRAATMASGSAMLAAAGALAIGGQMALEEAITPAAAAIAVFAALALAEALAPLHRGIAEIGRMRDAAARLAPTLEARQDPRSSVGHVGEVEPGLSLRGVSVAAPGSATALIRPIDLHVAPGEIVALTGRSGRGKSTLLNAISGLAQPLSGTILLDGSAPDDLSEGTLRARLGYLPQASRLVSGTIRSNLRLAAPDVTDGQMQTLLTDLGLWPALAPRGGLDMALGEGGTGLSGGEARRVALARVILRHPAILLLDEPTEGLDPNSANGVLATIKSHLPNAAVLLATHRDTDLSACDRKLTIKSIS
ncbi:thiol reductant ABC exporter subunit CydC [Roseibacterium sp. SDUM158016]|uniref:thiol reductant ABC exporter subunit CydC n=1 Tax=Roseicyclus sediminis TaxID=2980997 RepID=UPI0021CF71FD|nr:thiol reductant ABC exporter subunit CydC [Roseibacterium sp. SDUM158016]MCU4652957.1 thiol reductant ABC exporter subunit CydC [Roseibacterium sp. SDUM158016]